MADPTYFPKTMGNVTSKSRLIFIRGTVPRVLHWVAAHLRLAELSSICHERPIASATIGSSASRIPTNYDILVQANTDFRLSRTLESMHH